MISARAGISSSWRRPEHLVETSARFSTLLWSWYWRTSPFWCLSQLRSPHFSQYTSAKSTSLADQHKKCTLCHTIIHWCSWNIRFILIGMTSDFGSLILQLLLHGNWMYAETCFLPFQLPYIAKSNRCQNGCQKCSRIKISRRRLYKVDIKAFLV